MFRHCKWFNMCKFEFFTIFLSLLKVKEIWGNNNILGENECTLKDLECGGNAESDWKYCIFWQVQPVTTPRNKAISWSHNFKFVVNLIIPTSRHKPQVFVEVSEQFMFKIAKSRRKRDKLASSVCWWKAEMRVWPNFAHVETLHPGLLAFCVSPRLILKNLENSQYI